MPVIEFGTLGTLDLRGADGRELHSLLAQPKRIALLAYLCVAQPRGFHRRDTLLGLFWPDSDQEHARTSLRKSLHLLRRALGDNAILSRGDEEVAVDFQLVSCDAVAFEASVKAIRLEQALELYRGDLLAGFFIDEAPEFEQWLHSERTRLRACAARVALALSDQLNAGGNIAAAVTWANRSLELADTDERALHKLIELQCRAGDRAGAIHSYETFVRRLAAEYETEPSVEMRSLIERIRSGKETLGRETEVMAAAGRERKRETAPPEAALNSQWVTPSGTVQAEKGKGVTGRARRILYTVTALAVLIPATAIWRWIRPGLSKQVVRYALMVDSTEAMAPDTPWSGRLAISPDGSRLAYIGGPGAELLIRPRNQLHAIAMPGTAGAMSPFFSPDGNRVGFLREKIVQIASLNGSPPITVSDSLTGVAGASWGPDNFIYADGFRNVSLVRVEAKAGAVPRWFTTLDTAGGECDHSWPEVLPNGKGVLFTDTFCGENGVQVKTPFAIAVAEIPSGKHRVIVNDAMYARYASSGHLLYITTNKTLMVVPFDQNSMKIVGEPTALIESMRLGVLGSADLAVSNAGTLIYATSAGKRKQELVWVTRDGTTQSVDPDWPADLLRFPALSPDGKLLAVARSADGEWVDIWIKTLDRGPSIKLMFEGKENYGPGWTPDSRSVTFSSTRETGGIDLVTRRADGVGQAVTQLHENWNLWNARWSPDGKWLIFQTDLGRGWDLVSIHGIRPGVDSTPVPLVAGKFINMSPEISPNGRWLAYSSNESGQFEIYVVPFPNTSEAKWAVSTHGGTEPLWSHRGTELFYRDSSGNFVATGVIANRQFSLGRAKALFPAAEFESFRWTPQYAVAPDDRRFLMIRTVKPSLPDRLIVVENWFEELKAKNQSGR